MYTVSSDIVISKTVIEEAIKYNEKQSKRYSYLEDYYEGLHPILKRSKIEALKNNKIVVNHAEYITDVNVGYLLGNPVDYQVKLDQDDADIEPILEQYRMQTINDLDTELGEDVSKLGVAFEYIYADEEALPRSARIHPCRCIVVYDKSVKHQPLFGIMYGDKTSDGWSDVTVVTETEIYTYNEKLEKVLSKKDHGFGAVPLIEYKNNPGGTGDYEKVIRLIDAYNILQSDRLNDKEQLVESILVLYGIKLTPDQKSDLKEYRLLTAPPRSTGSAAEYINKVMQEADIDILSTSIEKSIHKISKTPNFSDDDFAGNTSGVAIKFKLIVFEMNIKKKERYFEASLKLRFNLYNNFMKTRNDIRTLLPIHKLDVIFHKGLPQNDLETSQMIANLDGKVDDETLISQLSFVQDAHKVIEKANLQNKEKAMLLSASFGTDEANGQNDPQDDKKV